MVGLVFVTTVTPVKSSELLLSWLWVLASVGSRIHVLDGYLGPNKKMRLMESSTEHHPDFAPAERNQQNAAGASRDGDADCRYQYCSNLLFSDVSAREATLIELSILL